MAKEAEAHYNDFAELARMVGAGAETRERLEAIRARAREATT
jgi:hypothetical protein